jgi:nicotinamidase-related amidase
MALTTLDPRTALVIIDLQKGIVEMPTAHPAAEIVARAASLAESFRRHKLPVILVHVTGAPAGRVNQPPPALDFPPEFSQFVPELNQQPEDHIVVKRSWSAITGTPLAAHLLQESITHIVLCGIATSIGVESTARPAYELGFNVTLVTDAVTDRSLDAHNNSLNVIFPRIAELGTTDEVLALLDSTHASQ